MGYIDIIKWLPKLIAGLELKIGNFCTKTFKKNVVVYLSLCLLQWKEFEMIPMCTYHMLWCKFIPIYCRNNTFVCIAPDKTIFFIHKVLIFFSLFLHENICCGHSLEVPQAVFLMNNHNICFCREIRKIISGFMWLTYLLYVFGQTGLSKQCRPRWDAAE